MYFPSSYKLKEGKFLRYIETKSYF